jgi:hypothetical protein
MASVALSDQLDPQLVQALTPPEQYLRAISLVCYGTNLNGLDLSNLRIKFSVKRSDIQTPNVADIRVYNVSADTALSMLINLNPAPGIQTISNQGMVILQAGYQNNYGVIFQGNIKQIILGRESATDTFVDIIAGDGDRAYNFAVVNTSLAAGVTPSQQLSTIVNGQNGMAAKGVTLGHVPSNFDVTKLPRGKTLYGNAKNYLRALSTDTDTNWSMQNEQINFIPIRSYLPGTAVVLTSKTGLVGTPQQTNIGVNVKCLLNPLLKIGGVINIAEATVADYKIDLSQPNNPANTAPALNVDGYYYIFVAEFEGDTRGVPWYATLSCTNIDTSANPLDAVQV